MNIWEAYPAQLVQVSDSRNQPCSVSLLGFWILEELEENFGCGLELKIEGIMIDYMKEPWLTFLNLRHQDVMARFDTHTVSCEGQEDLEVISSLIQQHQNVKMETGMGIERYAEKHNSYWLRQATYLSIRMGPLDSRGTFFLDFTALHCTVKTVNFGSLQYTAMVSMQFRVIQDKKQTTKKQQIQNHLELLQKLCFGPGFFLLPQNGYMAYMSNF